MAPSLLFLYRRPASTVGHPQKTPRISFFALQHFRNPRPFFFTSPFEEAFEKRYPAPQKSHSQGLATLSAVLCSSIPWVLLSGPNTLGLSPSELCSSSVVGAVFPLRLSLLHFLRKPSPAFYRCFSDFLPLRSRTPFCSPNFYVGTGPLLSWAFGPRRLSLRFRQMKSVSLLISPSRPWLTKASRLCFT